MKKLVIWWQVVKDLGSIQFSHPFLQQLTDHDSCSLDTFSEPFLVEEVINICKESDEIKIVVDFKTTHPEIGELLILLEKITNLSISYSLYLCGNSTHPAFQRISENYPSHYTISSIDKLI